ncbi:Asp-tRNA(Asn)/Glu-tRNA(Gln) amidotransferase subunit GatB [Fangia hongkongensis]|uniref:Asp-tRNA(Asn)/Glu-tRNA(Gln) amidotransferase subunit GatB n=1 Tax=Fangia hongkongensis TaxID=270495 RepID=UPI000380BFD6|nr:Asp-tRNA(Asn)/Glu-tRNA(Gln) amidotransferase subunit GatB [Fangia hongkongensis]MBK2125416.1 Asp-tRNA(Asn)/Glu-tRNA(Gln) amidotransferase subunit GatB [Fangia hongkongensis]
MSYEMVIGLEVHIQLQSASKIFSDSPTTYGQPANTQVSWIDLGMPGTLPIINQKAIDMAIMFGLATNATISKNSFFARKNYFYPDLAKGYQISQSDNPIVQNGRLTIKLPNGEKIIHIERAHLEEDAGKSVHHLIGDETGIDYNRAGTALLEIVTEPDFRSSEEVLCYLKTLHRLVRHLGICDGNMQEGSFRADVNLSIRKQGDKALGTRAELKNINSFRFIEAAIQSEFQRQVDIIESGEAVKQETRLYDPDKNETRAMRSKEDAFDYRYFPDPDLLPMTLTDAYIETIEKTMPLLPEARLTNYTKVLSDEQANYLMDNPEIANYFDRLSQSITPSVAFNWISIELQSLFNRQQIPFSETIIPAEVLGEIINAVNSEQISMKSAKQVLQSYYDSPDKIEHIIDTLGVRQVNDSALIEALADEIIAKNPDQAAELKAGKTKLMGFFVGQIMKGAKGKANPKQANEIIKQKLSL